GAAATLTVSATTNSTFGGVVAGAVALTKAGPATFTLTNANTYTAATTVTAGTLALVSATSTNPIAPSATVTVAAGGTLNVTGITAAGGFTVGATQALIDNGTVTGGVAVPAGAVLGGSSGGT